MLAGLQKKIIIFYFIVHKIGFIWFKSLFFLKIKIMIFILGLGGGGGL